MVITKLDFRLRVTNFAVTVSYIKVTLLVKKWGWNWIKIECFCQKCSNMVFFKLIWLENGFFGLQSKRNLQVLILRSMARSKMVHGSAQFSWSMGVDPPIYPCMNRMWIMQLVLANYNHKRTALRGGGGSPPSFKLFGQTPIIKKRFSGKQGRRPQSRQFFWANNGCAIAGSPSS